jgi:HK97 family phage major capsid protein
MSEEKNVSQLTIAELKEALQPMGEQIVAAYVKNEGLDKVDQKHMIIPESHIGLTTKEQLALTKKERFGNLMKALSKKDYIKVNAEAEAIKASDPNNMTTDGEGGYLVPDSVEAEILTLIPTLGQARQYINVGTFPRSVDNWTIPKESTGYTVYYPGEEGSITSTKLAISYITLVAKKAAAIGIITNELRDFASVSFVDYMNMMAARAFAIDEDTQVFGTGNTYFTGLFYTANTYGKRVQVANTSSVTYADVLAAVYGIDQAYLANAGWYMHRTILEKVRGILDGNDRPIFHEANGGTPATLMGFPIRLIERAPTSAAVTASTPIMLLGDLQKSLIKDKQGMRIDTTSEGTVDAYSMFQYDQTAIRYIRHWSFHPNWLTAYSVIALND